MNSTNRFQLPGISQQFFLHSKVVSLASKTQNWGTRSLYLCCPVTGWISYTPRNRVPFSSSSTTRRTMVEVLQPASTLGGNKGLLMKYVNPLSWYDSHLQNNINSITWTGELNSSLDYYLKFREVQSEQPG
jgi:hypothetical protein